VPNKLTEEDITFNFPLREPFGKEGKEKEERRKKKEEKRE